MIHLLYQPFFSNQHTSTYSAMIPASKIFNLSDNSKLKFYLFKFHDVFDGLIGLDNLKILQASLDFGKGNLITPYAKIKLSFIDTPTELTCFTITPRCEQKTIIKNREITVPHKKNYNRKISKRLFVVKNNKLNTDADTLSRIEVHTKETNNLLDLGGYVNNATQYSLSNSQNDPNIQDTTSNANEKMTTTKAYIKFPC